MATTDLINYVHPDIRNRDFPTVQKIRKAKQKADYSDATRNILPLFSYLTRAFHEGERVPGLWNVRKTALTSFERGFSDPSGKFAKQVEEANEQLMPHINNVLEHHCELPAFNKLGLTQEWELVDGSWRPSLSGKFAPMQFDWNDNTEIEIILDTGNSRQVVDKDDDRYIFAYHSHKPRGGIMRTIVRLAAEFYEQNSEWLTSNKLLKGLFTGEIDVEELMKQLPLIGIQLTPDKIKAMTDQFRERLKGLTEEDSIMTFKGTDVGHKKVVDSNAWPSFEAKLKQLKATIEVEILGQASTTELPDHGGSRAATQVLSKISADITINDRNNISEYVNERIVLPWWRRNYDFNAGHSPIKFIWIEDNEEDAVSNATVYQTLASTSPNGIQVFKSDLEKKTGVRIASDDEVITLGGQAPFNFGELSNASTS